MKGYSGSGSVRFLGLGYDYMDDGFTICFQLYMCIYLYYIMHVMRYGLYCIPSPQKEDMLKS